MIKSKFRIIVFCSITLGALSVKAQDAVPAAGSDASGAGGSAAYSVGQVVYTGFSSASGSVNQGVQQPYVIISTGVNNDPDIDLIMSVFPNPSKTFISLKIEKADLQHLSFQLTDVQGKILLSQKISSSETAILMEEYTAGNYFLNVIGNLELKTFKIIKN